jgi:hypothetical protein
LHEEDKFPLLEAKRSFFQKAVVDEWDYMVDDYEGQAPSYNQFSTKYDDVLNALKLIKPCSTKALSKLGSKEVKFLFENVENPPNEMQQAISAYSTAQISKY